MRPRSSYEYKCDCRHHPLLAIYGREEGGALYVHVRVYKNKKLYAEVYTNHDIKIMCRECKFWREIVIRNRVEPKVVPALKPEAIVPLAAVQQCLRPDTPTP